MYIKDPPPNAAKAGSKNLEKLTFGLSLKNNNVLHCKIIKLMQQNIVAMFQCQFNS